MQSRVCVTCACPTNQPTNQPTNPPEQLRFQLDPSIAVDKGLCGSDAKELEAAAWRTHTCLDRWAAREQLPGALQASSTGVIAGPGKPSSRCHSGGFCWLRYSKFSTVAQLHRTDASSWASPASRGQATLQKESVYCTYGFRFAFPSWLCLDLGGIAVEACAHMGLRGSGLRHNRASNQPIK